MHTDIDRLVEYHTWQNEVQMVPLYAAASKTAGKPVTTLCAIVDMGGMSSKLSTASACVPQGGALCARRWGPARHPNTHTHTHAAALPLRPPLRSHAQVHYLHDWH